MRTPHINFNGRLLRHELYSHYQPYIITHETRIPSYSMKWTGDSVPLEPGSVQNSLDNADAHLPLAKSIYQLLTLNGKTHKHQKMETLKRLKVPT